MAIYSQVLSTFAISIMLLNLSVLNGWPSSTVLLFRSANTTLNRPMQETEISLLGSLPAIGSLIGNFIASLILDSLGRKNSSLFASMMFVIAWTIIALTDKVEAILVAMFIGGIGGKAYLVCTVYVSEISQDSVRGSLTAMSYVSYSLGFMVSYLLGDTLGYHTMVYTCLGMALAGVLILVVMKDSPISLMRKGLEEDAIKSIAFYRKLKSTSIEVMREVDKIRRILNTGLGEMKPLAEKDEKIPISKQKSNNKLSCWMHFKKSSSTRREFFVVVCLMTAFVFQGLLTLQVYAVPIFTVAVSSDVISPSAGSIVLGLVTIVSSLAGAALTDIAGRRILLKYSCIAGGITSALLGLQLLAEWGPNWMTPVLIYFYTAFHIIGIATVAFVIIAEVFVPEVKSVLSMLAIELAWTLSFGFLFMFPLVMDWVGLAPVFLFFSAVCLATAVFCHHYLPETRGLPLDSIQELFRRT